MTPGEAVRIDEALERGDIAIPSSAAPVLVAWINEGPEPSLHAVREHEHPWVQWYFVEKARVQRDAWRPSRFRGGGRWVEQARREAEVALAEWEKP